MSAVRAWLMLTACVVAVSNTLATSIGNNKYRGVVIAINPEIPQDDNLVTALENMWTEASAALFTATKRRIYFGQITILVPKTWSGTYSKATSETYDNADVLVADPNPAYQDQPYTLQYGDCGQPATYIHLTPSYVLNDSFVDIFGPKGKALVHEWAHYRWGVFDETFTNGYSPFYFDSNHNVQATKCPVALQGVNKVIDFTTGSTRDCQKNLENGLMEDGCQFIPYTEQASELETSMMSNQYLQQVQTFCHSDSADPTNMHNTDAPNEQNRLCELHSTWDVIMESDDFAEGANPPITGSTVDTRPNFKVVQVESSSRYVLVLDTSGSMGSGNRLSQMQQAVSMFVTQFVADGDQVGIVEFNTKSDILTYMLLVNDQTTRDALLGFIPTGTGGNTCIGCGISSAIDVLEHKGGSASGGNIIVFTDGEENRSPTVDDISPEVISKDAVVNAIFFATDANPSLEQLVFDTNGVWFFGSDNNTQSILGAFRNLAAKDDGDVYSETFQVLSATFVVGQYDTHTGDVTIDATVGNSTVFTFTWSQYNIAINVVLEEPSGCTYSTNQAPTPCPGEPLAVVDTKFKIVTFALPGTAAHGRWRYYVSTSSKYTQQITATVTSQAADRNTPPIVVSSGLASTDVGTGQAVVVYAQVSQGYLPVLGASVLATIERPDGTEEYVDLYDAGAAPDVRKDDGVYSRYFTAYNDPGRYAVQVTVTKNSSIVSREVLIVSRANPSVGTANPDGTVAVNAHAGQYISNDVPSSDVADFERVVTSEGFTYNGLPVNGNADFFPPSKVIDLTIQQFDPSNSQAGIVIRFTAPGEDYDVGTDGLVRKPVITRVVNAASAYDIRYSMDNSTKLVNSYASCDRLTQRGLLLGNVTSPRAAGSSEMFIAALPYTSGGSQRRISFALKAIDGAQNVGSLSNVATLTLTDAAAIVGSSNMLIVSMTALFAFVFGCA